MRACTYISMAAMVDSSDQHPMTLERAGDKVLTSVPIGVIDLAKENLSREEFVARIAGLAGGLYDLAKEL